MNSKKNNITTLEIKWLKYYVYTPERIIYYLYSVSIVKISMTRLGIIWLVDGGLQAGLLLKNKRICTNQQVT